MRNRQPDGGLSGDGSSPVQPLLIDVVVGVGIGDRRQQRLGVGVGGGSVEVVGTGDLDQLPEVHDRHPVAHVLHHSQVVGDEHHGEVEPGLEVGQQIEDLSLHRHVEGGDRFVTDQQIRFGHQCPGDADALALATGELARAAVARSVGIDPHRLEHLAHFGRPLLFVATLPDDQWLGHDVAAPADGG